MIRRAGRPGLLGTMARTAVIAGTAGAVNRSMNRAATNRQTQADAAYREQQAAPAPTASGGDDVVEKLNQLGRLHASGVLTDNEFAAAKAKLLA